MKESFDNSIVHQISTNNPLYSINEKEFNESLLKFGSFLSILKNKRINQTMLLLFVLENEDYRNCFKNISEIDNIQILLYNLIIRFPILCKSKIIKNKVKELFDDKRKRKKNL